MFTELSSLLRKGDTLAFTVAREPDGPAGPVLRVNIMPKLFTMDGEQGADRKALNQPVSVVATPAELDSPAFVETLNRFTGSTNTLRHTIEEVEANHKSAAEAKRNASKAVAAKAATTKTPEKKSDKAETPAKKATETPAEPAAPVEETESIL